MHLFSSENDEGEPEVYCDCAHADDDSCIHREIIDDNRVYFTAELPALLSGEALKRTVCTVTQSDTFTPWPSGYKFC